ncbi:phenazine biosynthesis protein PhzF [Amycolatopsis sp. YIM 10]|uniref:phenazine biosynthesis protein PhzF n=1 Tax=Amycolatopsis sp. YIM 10 TaxID=2653857 RepID=UPI0012A9981B|nr:phenazine biosynthesis protein PhzF [Amycolatopsis sp. YIM 10]QFU90204.1 Phenazine biosynthesis-like protein [Amycolatopsis sp. YIM 10]
MRVTTVDMFGAAPGRGSTLDVLVPDGPCDDTALAAAAAHAKRRDADENALVSDVSRAQRTFGSRIFNTDGETPFATHSLAGVAACLVREHTLPTGEVGRAAEAGCQWLWTDGRTVRVPFDGPAVHQELPHDPEVFGSYEGIGHAGGVGRAFNFFRVSEDPRTLPAPDLDRMRELGITDFTLFRWDPDKHEVLARVFAPGFGLPEDAGCLPAAAALGATGLRYTDGDPAPVTVRQVTRRGNESVFHCTGEIRDGQASVCVTSQVWVDRSAS